MGKISKNALRRQKAKEKKKEKLTGILEEKVRVEVAPETSSASATSITKPEPTTPSASITSIEIDESDPAYQQFRAVFDKFQPAEIAELGSTNGQAEVFFNDGEEDNRGKDLVEDDDDDDSDNEKGSVKLSKRQLRIQNKVPLAVLKAEAPRPEVVEWYDADAPDARFLVYLKSLKNVVPVPSHWSSKRDYLSNKRAMERPPFQLPKFIEDTGISDMRNTLKEDDATLKQQMRARVQPQMGKLDLDYALLHNAFFYKQEKPRLYSFGDLYHERKEFQAKFDYEEFKPGMLSAKLSSALGIAQGSPPPWVNNIKKFGLPPSYPNLRVPGLNENIEAIYEQEEIDKTHWAELEEDPIEEDDDEEEEEEEEEEAEGGNGEEGTSRTGGEGALEAIPISTFGETVTHASAGSTSASAQEDNRPLYQILQQQQDKYSIPQQANAAASNQNEGDNVDGDDSDDSENDEKFDAKRFRF